MINVTILILKLSITILDGDIPALHPMEFIFLNSSYLLVADLNNRNKLLTKKLLKQGYQYHKLHETFSKSYRRYYDLISKFDVGLKSLLQQGLSEPEFYCK